MRTIEIPTIEARPFEAKAVSSEAFLRRVVGYIKKIHLLSRSETIRFGAQTEVDPSTLSRRDRLRLEFDEELGGTLPRTTSLLFQAAHDAFAHHVPFTLSPEAIWYAIIHEVAIYIKANPKRHAEYFGSDGLTKQTIEVRNDSLWLDQSPANWQRSILLFRDALKAKLPPPTAKLFLPPFSTLTAESEAAILVAFMDVVSSYFDFRIMTLCGIPKVQIEGTVADWELLLLSVHTLSEIFVGLKDYFAHLEPVLQKILLTVRGEQFDERFWQSIYKLDNGSGGPSITGWLTTLTAYLAQKNGFELRKHYGDGKGSYGHISTNELPSHISRVPVIWQLGEGPTAQEIALQFAGGFLSTELEDGFLAPRLGCAVYQLC